MKFSVFTVMTPDLTPQELVEELVECGIDGVEWRCKETPEELKQEPPSFWGNNMCTLDPNASDAELDAWLKMTKDRGIEVTSVTPYLTCGDIAATERVLYIARRLGAKFIRLGVPHYHRSTDYSTLFSKAIRYLEQASELCKQYGVKGLIETHHVTIAPSASLAYRLVERFDPDTVGVLFDPGNMVHEGYENYRMGLELLGPYLAHVHVKNAKCAAGDRRDDGSLAWQMSWTGVADGIVDWKQVITDLKAVGYDGMLGLEDFSLTYPSRAALRENVHFIRSLL